MFFARELVTRLIARGYTPALVDIINLYRVGMNSQETPLLMDGVLAADAALRKARFCPVYFADKCFSDCARPVLITEAERFHVLAKTSRLWWKFKSYATIISCGGNADDSADERRERRADPFLLAELENLLKLDLWQEQSRLPVIISCDKYRDWSAAYPRATADRDQNDIPALVAPVTVRRRVLEIPKLGISTFCWAR